MPDMGLQRYMKASRQRDTGAARPSCHAAALPGVWRGGETPIPMRWRGVGPESTITPYCTGFYGVYLDCSRFVSISGRVAPSTLLTRYSCATPSLLNTSSATRALLNSSSATQHVQRYSMRPERCSIKNLALLNDVDDALLNYKLPSYSTQNRPVIGKNEEET